MFGSFGVPELLFIFGLALLIFGPRKLPEIGRTMGRGLAEFRKATNDVKRTINAELIAEEVRESDPRRLMRESIRDVKDGIERAARGEDETAAAEAADLPAAAIGGIARGSDLEPADEPGDDAVDSQLTEATGDPTAATS